MKRIIICSLAAIGFSCFLSCGGGETQQQTSASEDTSAYTSEQPAQTYDPDKIDANAPVMNVSLEAQGNSMDVMAFSTGEIRVKSGTTVKIHFANLATDQAMKHNFFIVKNGTAESVAMAGNTAGAEKNFIPDDRSNILFASKVLEPGQSEDLAFAAPPAGTYQFVCTYPGHWQKMNGKFVVE
jgi:azurin